MSPHQIRESELDDRVAGRQMLGLQEYRYLSQRHDPIHAFLGQAGVNPAHAPLADLHDDGRERLPGRRELILEPALANDDA